MGRYCPDWFWDVRNIASVSETHLEQVCPVGSMLHFNVFRSDPTFFRTALELTSMLGDLQVSAISVNCSSEVKPGVVTGQALVDLLNYAKVEGLGFWKEKQNQ